MTTPFVVISIANAINNYLLVGLITIHVVVISLHYVIPLLLLALLILVILV